MQQAGFSAYTKLFAIFRVIRLEILEVNKFWKTGIIINKSVSQPSAMLGQILQILGAICFEPKMEKKGEMLNFFCFLSSQNFD